jgi:hypothetical protein
MFFLCMFFLFLLFQGLTAYLKLALEGRCPSQTSQMARLRNSAVTPEFPRYERLLQARPLVSDQQKPHHTQG